MSLQKLSVKFPVPIQFPEGVDGEDLTIFIHLETLNML
jgi:hypothetical protein